LIEQTSRTAVVGIGNILMGDEGIGVKAVWALERQSLAAGIELFDGGTAFQALTGQLVGFDKLIIVDAVHGGEPPGTIYRLGLEDVLENKRQTQAQPGSLSPLSLHDVGVIEALMMERLAATVSPGHVTSDRQSTVIIGIEPAKIELSMELSPTLQHRLPAVVQTVLEELYTRRNRRDCL
jgi:hydrogenase maturation protease